MAQELYETVIFTEFDRQVGAGLQLALFLYPNHCGRFLYHYAGSRARALSICKGCLCR